MVSDRPVGGMRRWFPGERGGAATRLLASALAVAVVAVAAPLALVTSVVASCDPNAQQPSPLAEEEIPADYLAVYRSAAAAHGLAWTVLAAIGWVESRHGTADLPGVRAGANEAGAAGPMQIGIGGRAGNTWGGAPVRAVPPHLRYGVDGNGDGVADVYDPADAIPAAAGYLVAHGAPAELRRALFAYNRDPAYVEAVLAKAAAYGDGAVVTVEPAGYLPLGCAGPATTAAAGGGAGPWGGYANGHIPAEALCSIGDGHRLRCDAAEAYLALSAAHQLALGRPLRVTDSYRSFAAQVDLYRRKPHLAARPGTSMHGWGLALDVDAGGFTGATYHWLFTYGPSFGWHHPAWARPGGRRPEPWHWEFSATPKAPQAPASVDT